MVGQAALEGEDKGLNLDEVVKASGYLHAVSQQVGGWVRDLDGVKRWVDVWGSRGGR